MLWTPPLVLLDGSFRVEGWITIFNEKVVLHHLAYLVGIRDRIMSFTQYLPHLVYSTALTSLGMHSLFQRKSAESERSHVAAQLSILDSMVQRLQAGEDISDKEFSRLWKLAKSHEDGVESEGKDAGTKEVIGWREVFLGRKDLGDKETSEKWDRKDLDKGMLVPEFGGSFLWEFTPRDIRIVREELKASEHSS